jgi:hypothetical protein
MAQVVTRRPLTAVARFRARVSQCGICVDQVTVEQVFLRVFRFYPINIIPPWLCILIYIIGQSSETQSHPIYRNNNNNNNKQTNKDEHSVSVYSVWADIHRVFY